MSGTLSKREQRLLNRARSKLKAESTASKKQSKPTRKTQKMEKGEVDRLLSQYREQLMSLLTEGPP